MQPRDKVKSRWTVGPTPKRSEGRGLSLERCVLGVWKLVHPSYAGRDCDSQYLGDVFSATAGQVLASTIYLELN